MKLTILTSLAGIAIAAAVSSPSIDESETLVYSVPPKSYQGQSAIEFWGELTVSTIHITSPLSKRRNRRQTNRD